MCSDGDSVVVVVVAAVASLMARRILLTRIPFHEVGSETIGIRTRFLLVSCVATFSAPSDKESASEVVPTPRLTVEAVVVVVVVVVVVL